MKCKLFNCFRRKAVQQAVRAFSTAPGELDTYQQAERREKEQIPESEIRAHWDTRAQRPGLQSVMSARHSLEENERESSRFECAVIDFLKGYIENKTIFELGVGIGRFTKLLASAAARVVGCDLSPIMLEQARRNLEGLSNVQLHQGKITEIPLAHGERFDLVFDSIVLLHILSPTELRATIQRMIDLSDRIFIAEHTYEGPNFPISKYSILRTPKEYEELFAPYKLIKKQTHYCAGDTFTLMLFERESRSLILD
ncbi:TPA: class I SAM-dependent methyltransferase [Candidatus Micrarchaeota archaeon]|nr:class I SAM-dependent methyltransferase [Candidatus Micrarchaeota archaeon]